MTASDGVCKKAAMTRIICNAGSCEAHAVHSSNVVFSMKKYMYVVWSLLWVIVCSSIL